MQPGSARAPEWRGDEISVLVRHYPMGGTHACLPLLPRRSKCAINAAAKTLGLCRLGRKPGSGRRAALSIGEQV